VESVFSTLVDPQMHIPEAASRVNGISNDMVRGKPTVDRILERWLIFVVTLFWSLIMPILIFNF